MSHFLIVGCGYVGSVLAASLANAGHTVHGLRRSAAPLPPGVSPIRADVTKPLPRDLLPPRLDGVVYAVAAKSRDESVYRGAYVTGLEHVLEAVLAAPSPPSRLLFTASTAVYGQHDGEWVDETSPTEPPAFNGRILLEAESRLSEAPLETSSLRLGGIYGPGRTSRLRAVAQGRAPVRAGPPQYTNRIHRDDAARALGHLLEVPTLPAIVLGVDDEPADERVVLEWMADALGAPAPEVVAAEDASPPRAGSKRCRNGLLRSLGFVPRYPTFRDGYTPLLDEVRDA